MSSQDQPQPLFEDLIADPSASAEDLVAAFERRQKEIARALAAMEEMSAEEIELEMVEIDD